MTLRRFFTALAIALCSGLLFSAPVSAMPERTVRDWVEKARILESQAKWEDARVIYELLLSQPDHGLKIRERYHEALRRCWQNYRHQDPSYRKEVLSVDFAQALTIYSVVSNTLLNGSIEKKKIDAAKLFRKGLDELDAALADPQFVQSHVPANKHGEIAAFRQLMRKTWNGAKPATREEAADLIGRVALAAEVTLNLNATVVVMEFACGACYAIDEYTVYLTPNQLRDLAQSLSRTEIIGVGMTLAIQNNRIVVHDVDMEGSAAEVLARGDEIIAINKKAVVDLPFKDVVELLKGPVGSMVEVQFLSSSTMMVETRAIPRRAAATSVNALFPWPNTPYAYLRINSFTETTVGDIDVALAGFMKSDAKGIILDLRANGGGVFDGSIETARRFLRRGIIASTLQQDSKATVYEAKNPNALTLPMTVLVDGDTASAAEVLAGALKDNNRATLIGQTTYGKGCTQCLLKLPSTAGAVPTGGMKVTIARVFSPKGVPYSVRGVVPHIFIDELMAESESSMTGRDTYVNRAIDELNRMAMAK